jgi:aldose 1-epimerase
MVQHRPFGRIGLREITEFVLTNAHGVEVRAINYGGIITSILAPDRAGVRADIVLGFHALDDYIAGHPYFGAIIGRYANRIARGHLVIDGVTHQVPINAGAHHLHGGRSGFDRAIWGVEPLDVNGIALTHVSPDGDQGYPGTLPVRVTYQLTDDNALIVDYEAHTDRPTHVNLTQHSYFNLAGEGGDVLGQVLTIDADRYTPVDAALIPTGELAPVDGTRFDFRAPRPIGGSYDHNWVLNHYDGTLRAIASVSDPVSGRTMTVATTEPGVQFYTGNFLDGTLRGKSGRPYVQHAGFCLETQHFPDTPNHPQFPSTLLREGERYHSQTVFTFGVSK